MREYCMRWSQQKMLQPSASVEQLSCVSEAGLFLARESLADHVCARAKGKGAAPSLRGLLGLKGIRDK